MPSPRARPRRGGEPTRTCLGCRRRDGKGNLLRVVAVPASDGVVLHPDARAVHPGRGSYVHRAIECLEKALQRRAFPRALGLTGTDGPVRTEDLRAFVADSPSGSAEPQTDPRPI